MTLSYDQHLAVKKAMVDLVVNIQVQDAKDRDEACEANGWRMSDLSGLYDWTIETIAGLIDGSIDAHEFLAATDDPPPKPPTVNVLLVQPNMLLMGKPECDQDLHVVPVGAALCVCAMVDLRGKQ